MSNSRTAWRPSICSPPSVFSGFFAGAPVGDTLPVRPAPCDENCRAPPVDR
jgi:hypothetical protein